MNLVKKTLIVFIVKTYEKHALPLFAFLKITKRTFTHKFRNLRKNRHFLRLRWFVWGLAPQVEG